MNLTHIMSRSSAETLAVPLAGRPPLEVSRLLPPEARLRLVTAAAIPDAFERQKAIVHATRHARRQYPQFFRTSNFDL